MNKVVQKPVDNYMENLLKSVWGKFVGKMKILVFHINPQKFPIKDT